jgi:hypothetical protein
VVWKPKGRATPPTDMTRPVDVRLRGKRRFADGYVRSSLTF